VRELATIEGVREGLAKAAESGDSNQIKAAMVKAKEQAGTLMSGGKMTVGQQKLIEELNSSVDHFVSTFGKWSGSPAEGQGAVQRLQTLIEQAGQESSQKVADIRQRAVNAHLAPETGKADTPEKKKYFLGEMNGLFSEAKFHGKPLFDEGKRLSRVNAEGGSGAPEAPAKKAAPLKFNPEDNKDAALAAQARRTKPGDPNYDSAQRWLAAHGLK
jgi:hypothetical protein